VYKEIIVINYALSFVAVVKAAGYTQAAKQTGISKAKLSRHVKELETLLGIQLLHRTTRTFALTEQGKQFFDSCQNIEEIYGNAIENLKRDFSSMRGILKVTAPTDFGVKFLAPIIEAFCKKYPLMNVHLSLSNLNENLTEQQYDLAIRVANQLPDSNLRMTTVMEFTRLICAAPAYLKNNKPPKKSSDLKNHLCATIANRSMNTVKPSWTLYDGKKLVNYSLDRYIEVDSYDLQKQLIESGVCIGRLPSYYVTKELASGKLVELLPAIKKPTTYVYLLYPDTILLPHKTRAFMDLAKEHFLKHSPNV
jgi:DNA-binding transcriptional LysR family regulator